MEPVRIGVLGCGAVSHMYLPILARAPSVTLSAVSDIDGERARAAQSQYGIAKHLSPDRIFDDPDIELVVNLTPIPMHASVTEAALRGGKHVYSEKPLANRVEDALALVAAATQRGLLLGCAPDTLLGSGFQESYTCLRSGAVGTVIGARGLLLDCLAEGPYAVGINPFFDMGPYYITALVNMFGPAKRVTAFARTAGLNQPAEGVIALAGVIEFEEVAAEVDLIWGTAHPADVGFLDVYGSEGSISFPNPNYFGDPGFVRKYGDGKSAEIDGSRQPEAWPSNLRGLGVIDLACSIRESRKPRAAADIACHVVEIIAGLAGAAETGRHFDIRSSCQPPAPLSAQERSVLLHGEGAAYYS